MNEPSPRKNDWRRVAAATLAVSAALSAPLSYFIASSLGEEAPSSSPVLRFVAPWFAFTLLLAFVFAAGILRMSTGYNAPVTPMQALMLLASVIGLCAFSVVPVFFALGVIDTKVILFGIVAVCAAIAVAAVYYARRHNPPGGG